MAGLIKLDTPAIDGAAGRFAGLSGRVDSVQSTVNSVLSELDWEVRSKAGIDGELSAIVGNLRHQSAVLTQLKTVSYKAIGRTDDTNNTLANEARGINLKIASARVAAMRFTPVATTAGVSKAALVGGIAGMSMFARSGGGGSSDIRAAGTSASIGSGSVNAYMERVLSLYPAATLLKQLEGFDSRFASQIARLRSLGLTDREIVKLYSGMIKKNVKFSFSNGKFHVGVNKDGVVNGINEVIKGYKMKSYDDNFDVIAGFDPEYLRNQYDYSQFYKTSTYNDGCYVTSESMLYNMKNHPEPPLEPTEVPHEGRDTLISSNSEEVKGTYDGMPDSERCPKIAELIAQGEPVRVHVKNGQDYAHAVVAVGKKKGADTGSLQPSDILIADPATGKVTTLQEFLNSAGSRHKGTRLSGHLWVANDINQTPTVRQ